MGRPRPQSTTLSAIFFNALIIPLLVPFALKGLNAGRSVAGLLLRRNLAVYGLGGIVAPFVGIKLIDLTITGLGLA
jgi:potassium-transporting ATPase ATP-binding subunit